MKKFPVEEFARHPCEFAVLKKLSTPEKVQDFLNGLRINFEDGPEGETCRSPLATIRERKAHCIEGALLAAAAFWYHGVGAPLVFDLRTTRAQSAESDHVVALFRGRSGANGARHGPWGAVSKTNHAVLRYRDPVYRTLRELTLSYFHEYFLDSGIKTLRKYSTRPFDLAAAFGTGWVTAEDDVWDIPQAIDRAPHEELLAAAEVRSLRPADPIEIEAGKLVVERHGKKGDRIRL